MKCLDPARMSREDVLAELGELLAAGFQRHAANEVKVPSGGESPDKDLDVSGDPEAQCGPSTETAT